MSNTIFDDYLNGVDSRSSYLDEPFDLPDLFGIKIDYTKPQPLFDSPISSTATIEASEPEYIDEDEEMLRTDEKLEPEPEQGVNPLHPLQGGYPLLFRTFVGKWEIKRK